MDYKLHWNTVYNTKEDSQLGWYEDRPKPTLDLIETCQLAKEAKILCVGAGTSTLLDALIEKGYRNLIANDLSEIALKKLQERIKDKYNFDLETVVDDLTQPQRLNQLADIDLWIDRAVLHFFLEKEEINTYFKLVNSLVAKNGYALIATFALGGAEKCSGLPLRRYDVEMLQENLGEQFELIESFNYTYINPFGGERPYVYTLFQKK